MKISEVPDELKVFEVKMSNGDKYKMTNIELNKALATPNNKIKFPNGEGFNNSFIVNWYIDIDSTREKVLKNKDKLVKQ